MGARSVFDLIENEPDDCDVFDISQIGSVMDGDWPRWIPQLMLEWIPEHIIVKYGEVKDSQHNGPFLYLNDANQSDIVSELSRSGYSCERNDSLIGQAMGYRE